MLQLLSGHYPSTAGQVALTPGLASDLGLAVGDVWHQGGKTRLVTGIVQNPQSLLDEFALVIPGQVTSPTQVTVLFDAGAVQPSSIGPNVQSQKSAAASNPLNPETIVLALATLGMLLIALVAVGGFTVLAQRRLRALGMLEALGATDRHVRLVVRANGVVVGVVGALAGAVLGLAAWLAYRPSVEASAHHEIGAFQLPWIVIGPAMVLAVLATYFAAARPARAITRLSIVTALSGRPAPPKQVHRSIVPGVVLLVISALLLWYVGESSNGGGGPELLLGLVALIVAVILLSGPCLAAVARFARHTPIAARLALRDLGRYRARSGSALAAISLGVLIAVLVCVLSAGRYGNVLDYAGPNLASNQIIVYTAGGGGGPGRRRSWRRRSWRRFRQRDGRDRPQHERPASHRGRHRGLPRIAPGHRARLDQRLAAARRTRPPVERAGVRGHAAAAGRLRDQGLPSQPGCRHPVHAAGAVRHLQDAARLRELLRRQGGPGGGPNQSSFPCPASECLANPVIQEEGALPSGTSAPNTVITEHAIKQLGLQAGVNGWLILAPHNLTAAQITNARVTAAAKGMTVETRNSAPSSAEIINWATVFGIFLALGILAMSVGLIRSETANDLRTLTATGADAWTRRTITAVTAGALGLVGAVLGTAAAYIGAIAYSFDNHLDGLGLADQHPGHRNLLIIRVGMPLIATVAGWLLAGREPAVIARQPME